MRSTEDTGDDEDREDAPPGRGPDGGGGAEHPPTLAAALLPMLLHSINNTTQLLIAIGGVPGVVEPTLEGCGEDLARAAASAHDHGWVLGVLGCELGADLLLARREERGLDPFVALVRQALRRRGGDLEGPARLPRLAPDVANGWELPWALAWLLWSAAEDDGESRARFAVRAEGADGWRVDVRVACGERVRAAIERISARLPEARFEVEEDGVAWRLPAAWLRAELA